MKKVSEYFKQYPDSKVVFQTSDGFLFHKEHDAKTHAGNLKDKEVKMFAPAYVKDAEKDFMEGATVSNTKKAAAPKTSKKSDAPKVEVPAKEAKEQPAATPSAEGSTEA